MNTHTIRLARPWEKSYSNSETAARIRVDVPEPEFDGDVSMATATYSRRFNRPTSLTPHCTVQLEISSWQGIPLDLSVNDQTFPLQSAPASIDVTSVLQNQNLIQIQMASDNALPPRLTGTVRLVITSADSPGE